MKRIVFMLFIALILCTTWVYASDKDMTEDVMIINSEPEYTAIGIETTVTVSFYDKSLYNEHVYLSYHILGTDGTMLVFENQRLPLELDDDGTAEVVMAINCAWLPELDGLETAKIQFDLVDQQNLYWFSYSPNLSFATDSLIFDRTLLHDLWDPSTQGLEHKNIKTGIEELFRLIVCLGIVALLLVGTVLYVRKCRQISSKGTESAECKPERVSFQACIKNWGKGLIYVLPVGCFSPVFLFCNNADDVILLQGAEALGYSIAIAMALLACMTIIYRRDQKGAVLATIIGLLLFWNYSLFETAVKFIYPNCYYWHVLIIEIAVYMLALWAISVRKKTFDISIISQVAAITFTALLLFNVISSIPSFVDAWRGGINMRKNTATEVRREPEKPAEKENLPNIYLFVFDEYSSSEMIQKYYGYDNSGLEISLENMGFQYSHGSRYAIAGTMYGLQSTLNMEYATELTTAALSQAMDDGTVFQLFRDYGYTTANYSAGTQVVENDFIKILFQQSVLMPVFAGKSYDYWYNAYQRFITQLQGMDYSYNSQLPTFSFIYFAMPHAPYVFDRNGGRQPNEYAIDYFSDYPYLEQYQYVGNLMLEFSERIVEQDPNAIIMLQSDHSMRWMYAYHGDHYPDYGEILNAIYYQGRQPFDNNGLNGANTLRLVANHVLDLDMPLLEDDYEN